MCGISGILHFNERPVALGVLQKINRTLVSRGPDDEGYYLKNNIGLAHRRLSIIDISGGHQPMTSVDGRYTLVFNGEIYNFLELKRELATQGHQFTTHSDSEVLLQLLMLEGIHCLQRLNGMFAFALWDEKEHTLTLARDRMGKKPLYYWQTPTQFVFASEAKAIVAHPEFSKKINSDAARHFFQYEYIPSPLSIFEGLNKLPQAHFMVVERGQVHIQKYWDVPLIDEKMDASEADIADEIIKKLDTATQSRLVSDVPLGVFLSGGLDSSAIVAMMARHRAGKDIRTFSIGFEEASFDESDYATLIAKKFGTNHQQTTLSASKMCEILPTVVKYLDEPFADASILPTYLLSQFTRQYAAVALGGDGGDELFAGYPTFQAHQYAEVFSKWPQWLQQILKKGIKHLPVSFKDMSFDFKAKQFMYGAGFARDVRNQVWLGSFHHDEMKNLFLAPNNSGVDPLHLLEQAMAQCPSTHPGDRALYFYQKFYLCDDILVKTDRASMANSLEVRAPFLDVNLVEYAAKIPFELKLKKNCSKYILKKALKSILPAEIIHRPKKGFGIPLASWLRGDLKLKMQDTLSVSRIKRDGLFNPETIQNLIQGHLSKRQNNRKQLFSLLMFHWWMDEWI